MYQKKRKSKTTFSIFIETIYILWVLLILCSVLYVQKKSVCSEGSDLFYIRRENLSLLYKVSACLHGYLEGERNVSLHPTVLYTSAHL